MGPWLIAPGGRAEVVDDYAPVVLGSVLIAIGANLFFVPNKIVSGGVTGVAIIAHNVAETPVGAVVLGFNVVIFAVAAFVFGAEAVMVALALAFVSARVLDLVQEGFSAARSALIISTDPERVKTAVLEQLGRGVTVLAGHGGYTGAVRPVLYVVVAAHEAGRLKRLVAEADPEAFVALTPAQEVLGEGFSPHPEREM